MNRIQRLFAVLAALFALAPATSQAVTFTDMWWDPAESGWGVNLVQQADVMFATLYVYGPDGKPAWYVAPQMLFDDKVPDEVVFAGDLYTTTGSPLGGTFDPAMSKNRVVGRITFRASSTLQATLAYTVDGMAINKTVERFTYRMPFPDGNYHGSLVKHPASNCLGTPVTDSNPISSPFAITLSSGAIGTGPYTLVMTFLDGASVRGRIEQYGALADVIGTMTLGSTTYDAELYDMTVEDDGIRGKIVARSRLAGCYLHFRFAAVRTFQ